MGVNSSRETEPRIGEHAERWSAGQLARESPLGQLIASRTLPGEFLGFGAEERLMKALQEQITVDKSQDNKSWHVQEDVPAFVSQADHSGAE